MKILPARVPISAGVIHGIPIKLIFYDVRICHSDAKAGNPPNPYRAAALGLAYKYDH